MNEKEKWLLSDELVRRMFDLESTSLRCPFCYVATSGEESGIPHMKETVFGRVEASTSGPGLIIKFECENDHRWQLRFIDHSGGTWLSVM